MRILWVHNFPPQVISNGIYMFNLHRELASMGVDIRLYYMGNLRGVGNIATAANKMRKISKQFDIVHAQYGSACAFITSFCPGVKVLSLRGSDLYGTDVGGMRSRAHGFLSRRMTAMSLRSYKKIVVMSDEMHDLVKQINSDADVEVIPSGVDLQAFNCIERQRARQLLSKEDDNSPWVLFSSVAGLSNPVKRFPLALKTVDLLRAHFPSAKLQILSGQSHNLVPLWINASNVVLLTSTHEGWPNIIKESLACNVPFVSTNVSDLKKIADLEPSCTVAPSEPHALMEGLLKALRLNRPNSLRRHAYNMGISNIANRMIRLYETIR